MNAPHGYISLTDPILSTSAIMGNVPANAANNSAAWNAAVAYALANDLTGIWHPGGIMPIDITPGFAGSSGLSLRGAGRLKSIFMKVGSATSAHNENDAGRTYNTRVGYNVTYPNAMFHVHEQWSEGSFQMLGLYPISLTRQPGAGHLTQA